jgi:hypothetical protein
MKPAGKVRIRNMTCNRATDARMRVQSIESRSTCNQRAAGRVVLSVALFGRRMPPSHRRRRALGARLAPGAAFSESLWAYSLRQLLAKAAPHSEVVVNSGGRGASKDTRDVRNTQWF